MEMSTCFLKRFTCQTLISKMGNCLTSGKKGRNVEPDVEKEDDYEKGTTDADDPLVDFLFNPENDKSNVLHFKKSAPVPKKK